MSKIDGGALAVEILKKEKVSHIFSLSGGHINPIYNACLDAGIRIIDTRHEEAAVDMASGWAEVTGEPGVVVVTAGPGVTNAFSAMVRARLANAPVVLIGGDCSNERRTMGAPQEVDAPLILKTTTKYAERVDDVCRIPEYLSTAFREARSGKPGPVFLSIPLDVIYDEADAAEVAIPDGYRTTDRPAGDPGPIRQAMGLLAQAESPVVLACRGVWWSQAHVELQAFIEKSNLPLYTGFMGRAFVPEDHPLAFGIAQPLYGSSAETGVAGADVVFAVGVTFDYNFGYGKPPLFREDVKVIQVDIDAAEIGRNRPVDIGIVGDPRAVLQQFLSELETRSDVRGADEWLAKLREAQANVAKDAEPLLNSDSVPLHPLRLCKEIQDFLPREATISSDGGDNHWWCLPFFRAYAPARYIKCSTAYGGLGAGIPIGLAAKLARPDEPVLVFSGDGSFGFNGMEFDTAVRHNIPIVCVVANDQCWGMILHGQESTYGKDRIVGTELGLRRYDKMVEALGGHGEFVERPEEIRPALERAFASGKPACVNVMVESLVSSGSPWFGSMA